MEPPQACIRARRCQHSNRCKGSHTHPRQQVLAGDVDSPWHRHPMIRGSAGGTPGKVAQNPDHCPTLTIRPCRLLRPVKSSLLMSKSIPRAETFAGQWHQECDRFGCGRDGCWSNRRCLCDEPAKQQGGRPSATQPRAHG